MHSQQMHDAADRAEVRAPGDDSALDKRAQDLAAKRTELLAKLGELVYAQTKTDPQARRGREVVYDGIAEVEREQENLKREKEHLAQLATPAGHAFCPFCGKQVSAAAIFCPQCGTRLTESDHESRVESLTDQLEELDLDEPSLEEPLLDEAPLPGAAAKSPAAPTAEDAELATTPGTSGLPAQVEAAPAAGVSDSAAEDDAETATTPAADEAQDAQGEAAADASSPDNSDAAAAAEGVESVLFSSRRDGIADALAPAADSVSAFHLAPQIIREARADLAPDDDLALDDEFAPAPEADLQADPGATQLLPVVTIEDTDDAFGTDAFDLDDEFERELAARRQAENDPDATQILPTSVVEAATFEDDATEVLPGTVDDAPDFEETDATRIMAAVPDDGDHYEPDPLQRTYRSF